VPRSRHAEASGQILHRISTDDSEFPKVNPPNGLAWLENKLARLPFKTELRKFNGTG